MMSEGKMTKSETAAKLASALYRDDMSRADEVPVETDGLRAYDGWLCAAGEAGDSDTSEALRAVDRYDFAAAWERLSGASQAAAALGRMGRGEAKRRGDSDHYRALAARRRPPA